MDVLVVIFEQLDPFHLFDCLFLSHIVGIKSTAFVVPRNEVLLESLQAYQLVAHHVLEHDLYLFFCHLWLISIQINLQTIIYYRLLCGV